MTFVPLSKAMHRHKLHQIFEMTQDIIHAPKRIQIGTFAFSAILAILVYEKYELIQGLDDRREDSDQKFESDRKHIVCS